MPARQQAYEESPPHHMLRDERFLTGSGAASVLSMAADMSPLATSDSSCSSAGSNVRARDDSSAPSSSSTSPVTSDPEQQGHLEIYQRIDELLQENPADESLAEFDRGGASMNDVLGLARNLSLSEQRPQHNYQQQSPTFTPLRLNFSRHEMQQMQMMDELRGNQYPSTPPMPHLQCNLQELLAQRMNTSQQQNAQQFHPPRHFKQQYSESPGPTVERYGNMHGGHCRSRSPSPEADQSNFSNMELTNLMQSLYMSQQQYMSPSSSQTPLSPLCDATDLNSNPLRLHVPPQVTPPHQQMHPASLLALLQSCPAVPQSPTSPTSPGGAPHTPPSGGSRRLLHTLHLSGQQQMQAAAAAAAMALTDPTSLERAARYHRIAAQVHEATCAWNGSLPPRVHTNPVYSCKVFLGGIPWDISESILVSAFEQFGPVKVEWPGRDQSPTRAKGYAYIIFEEEHQVKALLQSCTQDVLSSGNWYYKISSRRMKAKEVQVIPWMINEGNYMKHPTMRLDPQKTVFVGALHGMLNAEGLAKIMNDLFENVIYAGIDTDKHKYPIGSGRVTFSSNRSYMKAVAAAFIEIRTNKFTKKVQVDPYLEDSLCSSCGVQQGPYFCREMGCFRYFCRTCWRDQHATSTMSNHKPLMRVSKTSQQSAEPPRLL